MIDGITPDHAGPAFFPGFLDRGLAPFKRPHTHVPAGRQKGREVLRVLWG